MSKVYVLQVLDEFSGSILGIYSTRELAEKALNNLQDEWELEGDEGDELFIEEFEVKTKVSHEDY